MKLLSLSLFLILACTGTAVDMDVCESYVSLDSTGPATSVFGIFSTSKKMLKLETVQGFFYPNSHGSKPDGLVGLLFKSTDVAGDPCPQCTWPMGGTTDVAATVQPEVTIPGTTILVSWTQSLSADRSYLMGVTLTLADGSTLTIGTIGPETEATQHLGGPLHGVKWKFDTVITNVQLGFNSCHCTVSAEPFTSPVVLGQQELVTFTGKSAIDPNPFNAAAESC